MKGKSKICEKLYEIVGAVKLADAAGNMFGAIKYSFIKQVKDSKAYKELDMDWKQFCSEVLKRDHKTVNLELKMLEEYGESFMKSIRRLGLTQKDLNVLGSGLADDAKAKIKKGVVLIGDQEFKVSELGENIEEFTYALTELNSNLEEQSKELKAVNKVNAQHHKTIDKLHEKLEAAEQKKDKKAITDIESEFLKMMKNLRIGFDGYMLRAEPEGMDLLKLKEATPRMRAAYLTTVDYMRKQIISACAGAEEIYDTPDMTNGEGWKPGMGADV